MKRTLLMVLAGLLSSVPLTASAHPRDCDGYNAYRGDARDCYRLGDGYSTYGYSTYCQPSRYYGSYACGRTYRHEDSCRAYERCEDRGYDRSCYRRCR